MATWLNRAQSGLFGKPQGYGLLSDDELQAAQRSGMVDFGASLLAAGGPSMTPTSFGQGLGQAILQGRQGQSNAIQQALNAALLKKQMEAASAKTNPFGRVSPRDFTPESLSAFQSTGDFSKLVRNPNANVGLFNPGDYTPESFAAFQKSNNVADLIRYVAPAQPKVETTARGIEVITPSRTGGPSGRELLTTTEAEAAAGRTKEGEKTLGKEDAIRFSTYINEGLSAADGLPVINRAIELLDSVPTGGFDNAKLAVTNLFGVTGADESELSNNLGKAVLSQLRATFGAAFTEREGARLDALEANFGKSSEGNKRILKQVKALVERAARRGLDAAEKTGDTFSRDEIQKSLDMDLTPPEQRKKETWEEGGYMYRRLPDGTVQRKKK